MSLPFSPDDLPDLLLLVQALLTSFTPAQVAGAIGNALEPLGIAAATLVVLDVAGGSTAHPVLPLRSTGSGERDTNVTLFATGPGTPVAAALDAAGEAWFVTPQEIAEQFPATAPGSDHSGMVLSLTSGGETIGALAVAFDGAHRCTDVEQHFVRTVAGTASLALVASWATAPQAVASIDDVPIARRMLTHQFAVRRDLTALLERHRLGRDARQDVVAVVDRVDHFSESLRKRLTTG